MAEDMEMFLEQVIKKTNPEEYIKILEQDREDFAEEINRLNNIIDKLEKWLEEERDRLARECSNIYEDSLGKTKLVNEDIFNEITKIKNKLNELRGDNK